jgi:GxxExxY protein
MADLKYKDVTDGIINAFYHVNNALGYGFLEKVYENALSHELRQRGFAVTAQTPITVWYKGVAVGEYFADLVVNQCVIVELKCCASLMPAHEAQLINYLKATGIEVGLLLNFGPRSQVKRKVFTQLGVIENSNSYQRKSA